MRILMVIAALLVMFDASAAGEDKDALIALDRQWGEATGKGDQDAAGKFLADDAVSVNEKGVHGKQAELADIKPAPPGTRYEPTDYKVTFINPDTAIMTHSTKGFEAHHSLHVWSRKGGAWKVIATSSTPAAGKPATQ
jgi:uncharacterized protein DUF4440